MTAVSGLLVAIDLATRQRDDAAMVVAQVVRRFEHARQQLEQLQSYAADTAGRWSVASQASATPQIVGHYYQFMERLGQTIDMQQAAMAGVQRQREAALGQVARRGPHRSIVGQGAGSGRGLAMCQRSDHTKPMRTLAAV